MSGLKNVQDWTLDTTTLDDDSCEQHSESCDSLERLLVLHTDVNDLQDVVVGVQLERPDVDLDVRLQEVLGQVLHVLRPSRAPHERLTVGLQHDNQARH